MQHVHEHNIAHRDLKLENCFLDHNCRAKIADFGLNKLCGGENEQTMMTSVGTINYMAPEITGHAPYEGQPVDVFALGAVLFLLRTAKFAFGESGDLFYK